ncbi:CHASE2 domain-containing protein [Oscillatoria sp. FACHB-1406]|uniref:CHASE2 domain-containing protein n=1 Tax=Oscillatoria sp. FACHB-1406 TaxID=2692846 RepID=UPI001688629E|nr:CHASE2 domain-containing protein [Oscillatoria sp. FACHB-1406]MBD2579887.1 CHASE2 domain-containing protein [Oscillatoria sp. FACHB-1406]
MSKLIVLELDGDWEKGFRATLAITSETTRFPSTLKGDLPPNPELLKLSRQYWHHFYNLGAPSRIKIQQVTLRGSINDRIQTCKRVAVELRNAINTWLGSELFRPIADRLHSVLREDEEARFSVQSSDRELQKLPWFEWDLLKRCDRVEPALNSLEVPTLARITRTTLHPKVKILAILGNSEGIDVESDRRFLNELPNAEVTFLPEPTSHAITAELWEQEWDIIFFAGHSQTEDDTGRIYINQTESITIDELWTGLKTAVNKGLQLAIFNSCDGLGIANQLNDRSIPFIVVMREAVPDLVAQQYLRVFLTNFAGGESFHNASRIAREQLHGIRLPTANGEYFECPYATWLPVIYENPAAIPPRWEDLYRVETPPVSVPKQPELTRIVLASLFCTILVMFARSFGLLQPSELSAYDRLMKQRSLQGIDPRILIVEVSEGTNNRYSYPLPDNIVAQLLQTVEEAKPSAIGLSLLRYQPRGEGREKLIARLENNPHLFLTCGFNHRDKTLSPPPELSGRFIAEKTGFGDFLDDSKYGNEGTRRHLIAYSPDLQPNISACTTPRSLSFQLAQHYLQRNLLPTFSFSDRGDLRVSDRIIPTLNDRFAAYSSLDGGYQMMLNYRSNPQPAMHASVEDVLSGKLPRDRIEGKIVLIGDGNEIANTPDRTPYGMLPQAWIQAHATSQLLDVAIDNRPLIWALPQWGNLQWGDAIWVFIWSMFGGTLSWVFKKKRLVLGLSLGAILIFLERICLFLLERGGWMPLVPTVLALLATALLIAIWKFPNLSELSK